MTDSLVTLTLTLDDARTAMSACKATAQLMGVSSSISDGTKQKIADLERAATAIENQLPETS